MTTTLPVAPRLPLLLWNKQLKSIQCKVQQIIHWGVKIIFSLGISNFESLTLTIALMVRLAFIFGFNVGYLKFNTWTMFFNIHNFKEMLFNVIYNFESLKSDLEVHSQICQITVHSAINFSRFCKKLKKLLYIPYFREIWTFTLVFHQYYLLSYSNFSLKIMLNFNLELLFLLT